MCESLIHYCCSLLVKPQKSPCFLTLQSYHALTIGSLTGGHTKTYLQEIHLHGSISRAGFLENGTLLDEVLLLNYQRVRGSKYYRAKWGLGTK